MQFWAVLVAPLGARSVTKFWAIMDKTQYGQCPNKPEADRIQMRQDPLIAECIVSVKGTMPTPPMHAFIYQWGPNPQLGGVVGFLKLESHIYFVPSSNSRPMSYHGIG